MPVLAGGCPSVLCRWAVPAENVLRVGDGLDVGRVNAGVIAAGMVWLEAIPDRADEQLVGHCMGGLVASANADLAISATGL
jgi:hypothetical protein